MPKNLSGVIILTDKAGTTISNGVVTTNEVITKSITDTGDIYMSGGIFNGSNSILFNEPYQFVDIQHNLHVYGTMLLDYQGNTLNVGQLLAAGGGGGGSTAYPSITYNSSTGETTFSGSLIFPTSSIASGSINNSDFMTLSTSQNVSGSKTYSTQQNFSNNIRIDGSILLNSAGLTLNNSNLQKIQYLSNVSSDIAASLSSLSTKLTDISYSSVSPITTTINNKLQCSTISFSNTLNGVSSTTYGFISTLSANCQTQLTTNANSITSAQNDIQVLKDATRNLSATSSASTFANTLNTSTLNASTFVFSNTINSISATDFSNVMFYCKNLTSDASASILALQNKTQYLSYSANTSSFSNTLNSSTFAFSNTINGFSVLDFSNVMFYCKTLTSNCQDQITAATATAASGLALATTASAGVAGIVTVSIPGLQGQITAQGVLIGNNSDAIGTLQQKTTQISYNNTTSITTIGSTCSTNVFRLTTLNSGLVQDENQPVVFIGTTRFRNGVTISDGFGLDVSGGITQTNNSANTFNGSVSCIRDFTSSGTNSNLNSTNIQIGTSTAAALTVNATSTVNSDMTFSATKKLVIKNIVPRNLDDIYFGGEAGAYVLYNTIFNTKTAFNEPVSFLANYKQGTTALRYTSESFNSTYSVTANTSVTLSAPLVSIGNLLSATTVYGNLVVVGSITNSTGVLNMIGQIVQQF
jgi:hypothetical protein